MANIYKTSGDIAGALAKLATKLVKEGKTSNEIRETLAEKVPGATVDDIEKAVTPTLQSKVERGKELMVVEPGVARPVSPELSEETALVPTSRPAKTTFIAGDGGVSAGEQARPQSATVEERIRQTASPAAEIATAPKQISKSGWNKNRPLTATQKAMLGIGGTTAAGVGIEQALRRKDEGTPLVLSPETLGLPPEDKTGTKSTVDTKKEQQDKLTTPSGGDVTPPKELQKKAITTPAERQVQTAASAELTLEDFKKKLVSGEPLTRGDLLVVLDKMQNIKPDEVKVDTSVVENLKAAREEARNAYQSQASRNEWLEVAQTLGNAVATFIAAQRGVADRPIALPQIDYGERTTRALREYQTELGSIGEQERALERATERSQRQVEQQAEEKRRGWEKFLLLGEKQIEAAERRAAQDKDLATRIQLAKADDARRIEAASKKAATEQAKAAKQGQKEYLSALTKDSARLEKELNTAKSQLKAAQSLLSGDPKDFNKNFTDYVSSFSTTDKPVKREDYEKPGLLWGTNFYPEDAKKDASARAREIIEKIQFLTQEQNRNLGEQKNLVSGMRGVSSTAPQQPARQEPAAGGKVTLRDPKSGRTKEVLWDEAAQAVVKSGQLELVK
jgi:hypothetical protein